MTILPKINAESQPHFHMVVYNTANLKPWQAMTPFGPVNKTGIHQWDGKSIINVDQILAQEAKDFASGKIKKLPGTTNWNEYAKYTASSGVTYSSGNWTVPTAPSSTFNSTQVAFIFNDLMPSDHSVIIQPVLQWGASSAYSGNNWELVSWLVTSGGSYSYSTPISVSAGDKIYGTMVKVGSTWTITGTDTTKQPNTQTALAVSSSSSYVESDATLETATDLTQTCSYLPGNISFTGLTVGSSTPTYTGVTGTTWCHMSVGGLTAGAATLHTQS